MEVWIEGMLGLGLLALGFRFLPWFLDPSRSIYDDKIFNRVAGVVCAASALILLTAFIGEALTNGN